MRRKVFVDVDNAHYRAVCTAFLIGKHGNKGVLARSVKSSNLIITDSPERATEYIAKGYSDYKMVLITNTTGILHPCQVITWTDGQEDDADKLAGLAFNQDW